ncbi:hypothetical protein Tco_0331337 [Tanacetum coccineum]
MSGEEPATQIAPVESSQLVSTVKLPILKKGEFTLWSMRMEQVILNGDSPIQVTTDENGVETEYQLRFHGINYAKSLWAAIKSRFSGNVESKKMQKTVLKQQFENFYISDTEGLDKAYDRQRERKAKSIMLLAIPDEYQLRFHAIKDAKTLWAAIQKFKKDNGYRVVPPPLTGNYMPPLADLSFAGLDDFIYSPTANKTSASVSQVETSTSQTSNTSIEMPRLKSVRPSGVIIEDWVSDDEDIFQSNDLQAKYKPSLKRIEFTNARNESVIPKQAKKPRITTQNPKRMAKKSVLKNIGKNTGKGKLDQQTAVSTVKGTGVTAVKALAGCVSRPKMTNLNNVSKDNSRSWVSKRVNYIDPQGRLKHMIGNKDFLTNYQDIDGGFVALVEVLEDKYVGEILKKFGFSSIRTASTPMETNKALTKDEDGEDVDVYLYKTMIASLMYLTSSKPDIMFSVCACSRFQVQPKVSHLNAVKRIFRYLNGRPNLGLWYPKDSPFILEAFLDNDYASASLDKKSITRGCQFLGLRLISWQCKKQTVVANLTIEAEYIAASHCCGQVLWIQNQMLDYGYNFMQPKIHVDNESAIYVVKNLVYHSRTKHIEIRHHFIRDSYEKRLIEMVKIHTDNNVADLLTKAFDMSRFNFLVERIWGDSMERAITTVASLDAAQDSDNIIRTQTMAMMNVDIPRGMDTGGSPRCQDTIRGAPGQTRFGRVLENPNEPPLSEGHTSGSGEDKMEHQFELMANVPITPHNSPLPRGYTPISDEGRLKLQELMTMCTKLSKQVLDLKKKKDAQAVEILRLKKRVKGLERQRKLRTSQPRRSKYRQVESSDDDLNEEDASKQVDTLFMDGTPMEINMLVEIKYPLIKELLEKMLNLQLEAEEESTMAFELTSSSNQCLKMILNGDGPIQVTTDEKGIETEVPPKTAQTVHGAVVPNEDANQKFLRALPSSWEQCSLDYEEQRWYR